MSGERHLLKVYSDRTYVHATTVRHQGTTVALAMDDQRRLVYTVLDLAHHDEAKGELDAAYWSESPLPPRFPSEITDTGFAVAGATSLPVVKNGRRSEAAAGERLNEEEVDPVIHHGEAHGRRALPRPLGRYAPRRAAPVHRRGPPRRGPQAGRRRILRRSGARRLRHRPRGRQGAAGRGHPPCATGSCSSAGSPSPSWRPATVAAGTGPGRTRPRTAWARPTWKAAPSTSPHRNCPSSAT